MNLQEGWFLITSSPSPRAAIVCEMGISQQLLFLLNAAALSGIYPALLMTAWHSPTPKEGEKVGEARDAVPLTRRLSGRLT